MGRIDACIDMSEGRSWGHEVDVRSVLERLRRLNARRVMVQSPAGLRREAIALAEFLEGEGMEVILHGNVNYGACDPADHEARLLGCDALLHLGHSMIPMSLEVPTVFIPAFAKVDVVKALEKNLSEIRRLGRRIGVTTTVQHVNQLETAGRFLEAKGFQVVTGSGDSRVQWPGQVLGCNFSAARVEVDGLLFIGSGYFHPLGVALAVKRPVLAINPYSGDALWMEGEVERTIRRRWAMIALAMDAESFGVVVSTKRGQLRLAEAKRVLSLLRESGRKARLIAMNNIRYPELEGFGHEFDAYVVVACPRVPIDDAGNWRKPVLTPREVEMMLGLREGYEFDEIKGTPR